MERYPGTNCSRAGPWDRCSVGLQGCSWAGSGGEESTNWCERGESCDAWRTAWHWRCRGRGGRSAAEGFCLLLSSSLSSSSSFLSYIVNLFLSKFSKYLLLNRPKCDILQYMTHYPWLSDNSLITWNNVTNRTANGQLLEQQLACCNL